MTDEMLRHMDAEASNANCRHWSHFFLIALRAPGALLLNYRD
jgi:hypothetical protein